MKDSFILFTEIRDTVAMMPDDDAGQLFKMILNYESELDLHEDIEDVCNEAKVAFSFIRRQLDKMDEKYEETKAKRAEAGRKAMEKRWGDNKAITNDNKPITNDNNTITNDNKGITKITDNDTDTDTDNVNEILLFTDVNNRQTETVRRIVDEWNSLEAYGIKPVTKIAPNSKRYKSLRARLGQYSEEEIIDAIQKIKESDFLQGKKTDFVINFDWFVKPNNFIKVSEGNYDNKASPKQDEPYSATSYLLNKIAEGGFK